MDVTVNLRIANNPPAGVYDVTLFDSLDATTPVFHGQRSINDNTTFSVSLVNVQSLPVFGCAFYVEDDSHGFVPIQFVE